MRTRSPFRVNVCGRPGVSLINVADVEATSWASPRSSVTRMRMTPGDITGYPLHPKVA